MCRNIRTLHHFDPPATPDEIRASALQYVRKLSGMRLPSRANQAAFDRAVERVVEATAEQRLPPVDGLRGAAMRGIMLVNFPTMNTLAREEPTPVRETLP